MSRGKPSSSILEAWQRQVDSFATGGPQKTQRKQIEKSKLAGRLILPTSGPVALSSTQPQSLCEVRLTRSRPLDVTVSVENLQVVNSENIGAVITWGSEQGSLHTAVVDIARGWRHPFTASYLRVDIIESRDGLVIPGGQAADLVVVATIAPSVGTSQYALQTTKRFGLSIGAGGNATVDIPPWSKEFRLLLDSTAPNVTIAQLSSTFGTVWQQTLSGAIAYRANLDNYPVRLNADRIRLTNNAAVGLTVPGVVFGMSI